jgi:hypothetical protein
MGRPYAGFCPDPRERGSVTAIYLGTALPQPSSGLPGNSTSSLDRSLSDLAPGEVYLADQVALIPGGLLHHRFTLTADRSRRRSVLCGTVSRVAPGGCYPPPCSVEPGRSSAAGASWDAPADATVSPTHSSRSLRQIRTLDHRPDSSVRMRMQLLSGSRTTSSGAAARMTARSDSWSLTWLPPDTPRVRRAAPIP